jgi:translocation and assembly module TamB
MAPAQTEQEERDRGFLVGLIEDNLSGVSRRVIIDGFAGALSSRATIEVLTIADAEGIWFRAEGLAFEWIRSGLLQGAIDVQEMSADSIMILRAPINEPQPPDPEASPFSLPNLPVSVEIDEIRAGTITLGPSILGEELVLTLDGTVSLIAGQGTADLSAVRLDGGGQFQLAGSYSNDTRALSLTLDLAERENGLVANLLDLSGRPSLDLTIDGSGPIDGFNADLTLGTDGIERVTGQFGLVQRADEAGQNRLDLAFDLAGDVGAMLPPDYAGFFGSDVSLGLRVARQEDGAISLSRLEIDAEALTLSGTADLAADGWPRKIDVTGRIASRDGTPVLLPVGGARTFVQSTDLEVHFDAADGDRWDGIFDLRELNRPGVSMAELQLSGGGQIQPATAAAKGLFTANLRYAAPDLQLEDEALARAIGPSVQGDIRLSRVSGEPFRVDALTMDATGLSVNADAAVDTSTDGLQIRSTARIDVDTLSRFALISGLADLAGSAELTIDAEVEPLSGGFDLSLSGQTGDLKLGLAALDPLLDGQGALDLRADRDETGTRLSALTIRTDEATVEAQATLTSGASDARFDIAVRDMSRSLPGLSGAGRLTGTLIRAEGGDLSVEAQADLPGTTARISAEVPQSEGNPVIQADIRASVADLAPYSAVAGRSLSGATDLTVGGILTADLSLFDVTIDASGTDLGLDVARVDPLLAGLTQIEGRLIRTAPLNLQIDGLSIANPAVRADASGDFTDGVGAATIGLTLRDVALVEPRLTGPVGLTGKVSRDASGALGLDVLATGPGGAVASIKATRASRTEGADLSGALIATLADLAPYSTLAGRRLSGAADATLSGSAAGDLGSYDLSFDLAGRDLDVAGVALPGGVTATGTASQTIGGPANLTLAATGPGDTVLDLRAEASRLRDGLRIGTDLTLSAGSVAPYSGLAGRSLSGGIGLDISGFFSTDIRDLDLTIAAETTNLGVGIPAVATLLRGTGTLALRASRTGGEPVNIEGLRLAYPNLSAQADLQGRGGGGTGSYQIRLSDIGLFTPDLSGPVTATGEATRNPDGVWRTTTTATGPGGISAGLAGTVTETGLLDLAVDGVAPLGLANAYIEPRRLQGQAAFDLSIVGRPSVDAISGVVQLQDARIAEPTLGRALDITGGRVDLSAGRATVDIGGTFDTGGSLRVSGPVALSGGFDAALEVVATGVTERDPTLYETVIDGQLSVTGPLAGGARIAGRIDLGATEIRVPSSDLSSLGDLPRVTHLNAPAPVQLTLSRAGIAPSGADAPQAGSGRTGPVYPLDIVVNAPARLFIRGRGLDAELGGSLTLTGTSRQVIPAGQFSLIRGRIDILQQRFALDEGSISLQGDFKPFVRLVATTAAKDGTAISIVVEGPVSEPVVSFVSSPELPQDEVLARLIFDQPLSEITPFQAVQLAAAVSTLAGRGGGGLIGEFRQGIGLDDLDITTDDDGGVAVRAGKYLTENVYTDVTVGSDQTRIELNLDLTDDVTITGRANSDGETGLGIFFERDY